MALEIGLALTLASTDQLLESYEAAKKSLTFNTHIITQGELEKIPVLMTVNFLFFIFNVNLYA